MRVDLAARRADRRAAMADREAKRRQWHRRLVCCRTVNQTDKVGDTTVQRAELVILGHVWRRWEGDYRYGRWAYRLTPEVKA